MPVLIHWAANFLLGHATARAVRGAPALQEPTWAPWPLLFLGALQAALITPCVTYLFRYWPAWSTFYLFDPAEHPSFEVFTGLLSALVVAINFALAGLGFACGRRSVRQGQSRWLHLPVAVCASVIGLCVAYLGDRMTYAGDYDTFWRGEAPLVVATPAGWVGAVLCGAGVVFVSVLHKRFSQRDPIFI